MGRWWRRTGAGLWGRLSASPNMIDRYQDHPHHHHHFPHHPKYSSWWWSSGQDYGDSLISLQFNTSNMIIIGLCIGFAIVTEICIIGAVKWWRNVATLWHFALPLLRKVAATHHFVVTLCLHRYLHIPAQGGTFLYRGAHLHIHVVCTLCLQLHTAVHTSAHHTSHRKQKCREHYSTQWKVKERCAKPPFCRVL